MEMNSCKEAQHHVYIMYGVHYIEFADLASRYAPFHYLSTTVRQDEYMCGVHYIEFADLATRYAPLQYFSTGGNMCIITEIADLVFHSIVSVACVMCDEHYIEFADLALSVPPNYALVNNTSNYVPNTMHTLRAKHGMHRALLLWSQKKTAYVGTTGLTR